MEDKTSLTYIHGKFADITQAIGFLAGVNVHCSKLRSTSVAPPAPGSFYKEYWHTMPYINWLEDDVEYVFYELTFEGMGNERNINMFVDFIMNSYEWERFPVVHSIGVKENYRSTDSCSISYMFLGKVGDMV